MNERAREIMRQLDEGTGGSVSTEAPVEETEQRERGERLSTADVAAGAETPRSEGGEERMPTGPGRESTEQAERPAPLFTAEHADTYRGQWRTIQAAFVDDPRNSVEDADALVAQVMKELAEMFAQERSQLEGQWTRGDDVSTEDLRVALRRYRSFFDRLLSL